MHTFDDPAFALAYLAALLIVAFSAMGGIFALRERRQRSQRRNMRHIRLLRRAVNRRRPRE